MTKWKDADEQGLIMLTLAVVVVSLINSKSGNHDFFKISEINVGYSACFWILTVPFDVSAI